MAQPREQEPFRVRFAVPLTVFPFLCGIATAIPLWGERAKPIFFATAAEVIALGAVAMALQGSFFRVSPARGNRGGWGLGTILISVGVGLAFAFGALAREDGGADPHMALTAAALSMGIAAFAIQALFGTPGMHEDE